MIDKTKIDTTSVKQSIDLRELAGRYTHLHRASAKEFAGACPKCGGDDRFHVTVDRFMCRQCHSQWGDAIEFVRWVDGVSFKEAVNKLGGNALYEPVNTRPQPNTRPQAAQSPEWIAKATRIANAAHERLFSPDGKLGADYLVGRGLQPHVWHRHQLGYCHTSLPGTWDNQAKEFIIPPQPAIVIPWQDEVGQVKAIHYRFLQCRVYTDVNGQQRQTKQKSEAGSQFAGLLYGWLGLHGGGQQWLTLLICEGELNALSIWQMQHDAGLDVLSLGSESQRLTPEMISMARQYSKVIVWADRNDIAWQLQQQIEGAYAAKSPNEADANDLLQRGQLGGHLAGIRYKAAITDDEKEALLWDVYDTGSTDAGTIAAMQYIANQLGKQIRVEGR